VRHRWQPVQSAAGRLKALAFTDWTFTILSAMKHHAV